MENQFVQLKEHLSLARDALSPSSGLFSMYTPNCALGVVICSILTQLPAVSRVEIEDRAIPPFVCIRTDGPQRHYVAAQNSATVCMPAATAPLSTTQSLSIDLSAASLFFRKTTVRRRPFFSATFCSIDSEVAPFRTIQNLSIILRGRFRGRREVALTLAVERIVMMKHSFYLFVLTHTRSPPFSPL